MEPTVQKLSHPDRKRFAPRAVASGFINAAYMTPMPTVALDALHACVERNARPDFAVEDFFGPPERVRSLLAQVIGGEASQFSLTGSVSFGLSTLAWNLRIQPDALVGSRRVIVGIDGQFPSNVQVWRRLSSAGFSFKLVPGGAGANERLLAAIDERTALVSVAPLSWTDGLRLDVAAVAAHVKAVGALLALDVTQSAGVDAPLPDELACDMVVGAGYKWLLGPYGTGFLRLSSQLQERLEPLEPNWKNFRGADDFNALGDYRPEFMSPAACFDHGESSAFLRLAALEASLKCLLAIGLHSISEHGRQFGLALAEGLDRNRYAIGDVESDAQASHLFRISPLDEATFEPLSEALSDAGLSISQRNGGWRISPHVYNDAPDMQRILDVLH